MKPSIGVLRSVPSFNTRTIGDMPEQDEHDEMMARALAKARKEEGREAAPSRKVKPAKE